MSKTHLDTQVIKRIQVEHLSMRPRWIFVAGTILAGAGMVLSLVATTFALYILQFSLFHQGYGATRKVAYVLGLAPWHYGVLALLSLWIGLTLLRRFDVSYKKQSAVLLGLILLGLALGVYLIDRTGLDDMLYQRGFLRLRQPEMLAPRGQGRIFNR